MNNIIFITIIIFLFLIIVLLKKFRKNKDDDNEARKLAKEIVKIKKLDCKIIPCKSTEFKTVAKRPFYSALNNEKFSSSFSFEIKKWQEALELSLQETNLN